MSFSPDRLAPRRRVVLTPPSAAPNVAVASQRQAHDVLDTSVYSSYTSPPVRRPLDTPLQQQEQKQQQPHALCAPPGAAAWHAATSDAQDFGGSFAGGMIRRAHSTTSHASSSLNTSAAMAHGSAGRPFSAATGGFSEAAASASAARSSSPPLAVALAGGLYRKTFPAANHEATTSAYLRAEAGPHDLRSNASSLIHRDGGISGASAPVDVAVLRQARQQLEGKTSENAALRTEIGVLRHLLKAAQDNALASEISAAAQRKAASRSRSRSGSPPARPAVPDHPPLLLLGSSVADSGPRSRAVHGLASLPPAAELNTTDEVVTEQFGRLAVARLEDAVVQGHTHVVLVTNELAKANDLIGALLLERATLDREVRALLDDRERSDGVDVVERRRAVHAAVGSAGATHMAAMASMAEQHAAHVRALTAQLEAERQERRDVTRQLVEDADHSARQDVSVALRLQRIELDCKGSACASSSSPAQHPPAAPHGSDGHFHNAAAGDELRPPWEGRWGVDESSAPFRGGASPAAQYNRLGPPATLRTREEAAGLSERAGDRTGSTAAVAAASREHRVTVQRLEEALQAANHQISVLELAAIEQHATHEAAQSHVALQREAWAAEREHLERIALHCQTQHSHERIAAIHADIIERTVAARLAEERRKWRAAYTNALKNPPGDAPPEHIYGFYLSPQV